MSRSMGFGGMPWVRKDSRLRQEEGRLPSDSMIDGACCSSLSMGQRARVAVCEARWTERAQLGEFCSAHFLASAAAFGMICVPLTVPLCCSSPHEGLGGLLGLLS